MTINDIRDLSANCDHMPGPGDTKPVLTVSGTVVFNEGGWSFEIAESQHPGPRPDLLVLELLLQHEGDVSTKDMPEVSLYWSQSTDIEYAEVEIRPIGGDGDESYTGPVKHLETSE